MKNLKSLGKALSKAEQKSINGGRWYLTHEGDHGGYQCCNQWGCGECVTGSNEDCSVYGGDTYGQHCTPS